MKCEFQWIPPADLGDWWSTIKPGLCETAEKAPGGWTPNDVFLQIAQGHAMLHTVMVDKYYRGFLVSKTVDCFEGKKLLLWIGYSNETGKNLLVDNIEQLREWAKKIGAVKMQMQSPRKGWERVSKRIGFVPTMTIYESDITKEVP